jgi:hypothetical protein
LTKAARVIHSDGQMDLAAARTKAKRWGVRIAIGAPLLLVVGFALYTYSTLSFSYSKGEHVGFVQKLAKRGWLCKTEEGDLAMVNMAGQPAQMFSFTVRDDLVAKQIEDFAGHRVVLEYEEHRGIPSSCFGETDYFVTSVRKTD